MIVIIDDLKTREMEFRTIVPIEKASFQIEPLEEMLFVGSCFADSIGRRFIEDKFRAVVNPFGVMYNPASILHTIERCDFAPQTAILTLGTNHVYRLKETGEIVDNCEKRPARLFEEEQLSIEACANNLQQAIDILRKRRSDVRIILTVSPIRYRKYGYHESQLSKATLMLAINALLHSSPIVSYPSPHTTNASLIYFPAYEIMMDELRDYRFYSDDMLHPSSQAVEYIWQRFGEMFFSERTQQFLTEWRPIKAALGHRPFNPDSDEYRVFLADAQAKEAALISKYSQQQSSDYQ